MDVTINITDNNTKSEMTKVCRKLLWSLSEGQSMRLINDSFNLALVMQMEPLNTVFRLMLFDCCFQ